MQIHIFSEMFKPPFSLNDFTLLKGDVTPNEDTICGINSSCGISVLYKAGDENVFVSINKF